MIAIVEREQKKTRGNDALSVDDVSVNLSGRRILSDVSLRVSEGSFSALVGPNGAGKTTLLRAILGLIPVEQGKVWAESLGYVPQNHHFAWDFPISVRGVVLSGRVKKIGLFRRASLDDHRAVSEALDRVGLSDLADRPVGQLSGGQKQRVLVARALAIRPKVLLLDEPFTGLDMPTQESLTELFLRLTREQVAHAEGDRVERTTLLMSTHDLGAAVDTCDSLILLNRRVIAAGKPAEMKNPEVWMETFCVGAQSPLLRTVGATVGEGQESRA